MRILIALFIVLAIPINIWAQEFSSPEKTLDTYLNALKSGNELEILDCFHPKLKEFYLPAPVPIKSYKIVKKIFYGQKEAGDWNSKGIVPPAKNGHIDLQVEQESYGKKRMFSYLIRNVKGSWKIISHTAWDQP